MATRKKKAAKKGGKKKAGKRQKDGEAPAARRREHRANAAVRPLRSPAPFRPPRIGRRRRFEVARWSAHHQLS
jgi:hypothetical protein